MTASQPAASQPPPHHNPPPAAAQITALDGNRAALVILLVQAGGASILVALGVPFVPAIALSVVLNLALLFTVFRRPFAVLRADMRWRTLPPLGTVLGAFVLAFVASRAWAAAALLLFPGLVAADTAGQLLGSGVHPLALLFLAGLAIPFLEEIAFRGLMLRGHERAAGYGVAALTTTVAFSLAHGAPASVAGIVPLAYALARVVQYTGSFWSGVIIHLLNNSLALGLGLWLMQGNPGMLSMDSLNTNGLGDLPAQLRTLSGLMALAFGAGLLAVMHFWLRPKPDSAALSRRGPWLSGSFVVIVLFGLVQFLLTFPAVQGWAVSTFSLGTPTPVVP